MESLLSYLRAHPFLESMSPRLTEIIVGCASNVKFDAGDFIFREGETANSFYLLRHGKVSLEVYAPEGGSVHIQTIGSGELLGWSWQFAPYTSHFDARAMEMTRAIQLDAKCIRQHCEKDYELGYEILKRFAHVIHSRFEAMRFQLIELQASRTY